MNRLFDIVISVFAAIGVVVVVMTLTCFQIKNGDKIIYTGPFYGKESK